jgi:HEAT repeat protein
MRTSRILFVLFGLAVAGGAPAGADDPKQSDPDEARVKAAGVKSDGPALLVFFKKRTLNEDDQDRVQKLIRQLGARAFRAREDAATELIARGPVVLDLLRESLKDGDLEIVRRATCCIHRIQEKDVGPDVVAAAARLLAARKPAGAVEALLAYLPAADSETVADELRTALTALAARAGEADKALVAALASKSAARRGSAAEALTRAGVKGQRAAVRQLLSDPDPEVRLRVATALANARDKEAIPVMIALLEVLPRPQVSLAEDLLYRLAEGQLPPAVSLGTTAAERKKCRAAWDAWWASHQDKADLARLEQAPLLGYTLLVFLDEGRIVEVDGRDKVRWQVDKVNFPLDVQLLPNDLLLVAEYNNSVITERTLKGEVKWQYPFDRPIVAQRLPNGHTFLAADSQVQELDAARKVVFTFTPPEGQRIMKAVKLANGETLCLTNQGQNESQQVLRVDAGGKVIGTFKVGLSNPVFGGRIQGLANGNVLVPHLGEDKVVEYDRDGKAVWEVTIKSPIVATRLRNGNTLVTSMEPQNFRAVEVDRSGREVWRYDGGPNSRVTRALRR